MTLFLVPRRSVPSKLVQGALLLLIEPSGFKTGRCSWSDCGGSKREADSLRHGLGPEHFSVEIDGTSVIREASTVAAPERASQYCIAWAFLSSISRALARGFVAAKVMAKSAVRHMSAHYQR